MKKDIESKEDIQKLIDLFYQKVRSDKELSIFFEVMEPENWKRHITLMCGFWENILFYAGTYSGNPMYLHKHIHHLRILERVHFHKWVQLYAETCHELYSGKNTEMAIHKAEKIASIMENTIHEEKKNLES
jgi:hemoglobin